jgi:hypothetical protein
MKAKDVKEREKIKKIEQELNLKIIKPGDAGSFLSSRTRRLNEL